MTKTVVHVAEVEVALSSGMGRVAWHWREEFLRRGYRFHHIGPAEVGPLRHKALFPGKAYQRFLEMGGEADVCIVHEPASAPFATRFPRTVVLSHGLERRGWEAALATPGEKIRFRSKILFPLWRIRPAERGIKRACGVMVPNEEDREFVMDRYRLPSEKVTVFRNGVDPLNDVLSSEAAPPSVLFLGSWLPRKGTATLIEAASALFDEGIKPQWTLAGTGVEEGAEVISTWPERLRPFLRVIPTFTGGAENAYLMSSHVFVLPSFSEGQPLALLQAMEAACCCVTTNCCGQRDLIKNGENGFLFAPGNAKEFATLIRRCLDDPGLRAKLGQAARRSVQDRGWTEVSREAADRVEEFAGIRSRAPDAAG